MSHELHSALVKAAEGDRGAAENFFSLFLSSSLIVPDRTQPQPLSLSPRYPNDLTYVLGIQEKERVFIPAFLSVEEMQEWSPALTNFRTITGRKLFELAPEEWWVCFLPGHELSKEFSPWEIEKLKGDHSSIQEVLEDLFPAQEDTPLLTLELPASEEFTAVKAALTEYFRENEEIRTLYVLKQNPLGGEDLGLVIVGAEIVTDDETRFQAITTEIRALAERCQIGGEAVKVLTARSITNVELELCRKFEPFLIRHEEKKRSLFQRLFGS